MLRTRILASSLLLPIAVVACGDDPVTPPAAPEFRSAVAQANPNNTISAVVTVTAVRYDSAFVRYWQAGQPTGTTPTYPFDGDSTLRIPVLGLASTSSYSLETNVLVAGAAAEAVDTAAFSSGSLPAWIPPAVAVGTDTTPGFLALSYPDGPVIVDNSGRVVWYKDFPNARLNTFQAHANGWYTIMGLGDPASGFHVLDDLGEEVQILTCDGRPTRFHDLLVEADSSAWVLCDETRTMDLSSVGGVAAASVTATVLQHLASDGQLLFEWNSFDHFAITDLPLADRNTSPVNFTHGNGIAIDHDGNLLLSFRSLSEVTKVDRATGNIIWRFGGLQNQFTILNDPKGFFERQHGMRPAGPGQIQFLDNGAVPPSRMVRYLMDPVARTALLVMEFIDSPTTFTSVGGTTQYYSNGKGLVSFAQAGRVVEVDPAGNRAWELTGIDNVYVFRAQRIVSLYAHARIATSP
jgi:hypothetical protein